MKYLERYTRARSMRPTTGFRTQCFSWQRGKKDNADRSQLNRRKLSEVLCLVDFHATPVSMGDGASISASVIAGDFAVLSSPLCFPRKPIRQTKTATTKSPPRLPNSMVRLRGSLNSTRSVATVAIGVAHKRPSHDDGHSQRLSAKRPV